MENITSSRIGLNLITGINWKMGSIGDFVEVKFLNSFAFESLADELELLIACKKNITGVNWIILVLKKCLDHFTFNFKMIQKSLEMIYILP